MNRVTALLLGLALALGANLEVARAAVVVQNDVAYGSQPANLLNVCSPSIIRAPAPALVVVHGGGWSMGDKDQTIPQINSKNACTRYAAQGWVVFNLEYRLVQSTGAPYPNPTALNTWGSPTSGFCDVQTAIRWIRANAAAYKVDPNRVYGLGMSAGANLIGLADTIRASLPYCDQVGSNAAQSPALRGAVGLSMPADLTIAAVDSPPAQQQGWSSEKNMVNCDAIAASKECFAAASPINYVAADTGPMAFIQGNTDATVLPVEVDNIVAAMSSAGRPYMRTNYDGGHMCSGISAGTCWGYIDAALSWLVSQ